jgi:hypothetical protein
MGGSVIRLVSGIFAALQIFGDGIYPRGAQRDAVYNRGEKRRWE